MLDLKLLERDPEGIKQRLLRRGAVPQLSELLALMHERKTLIASAQILQEKRNAESKALGQASKEEIEHKRAGLREVGERIREEEAKLREVEEKLAAIALAIPNIPRDDVPDGLDDSQNPEVKRVGEIPHFAFAVKDHVEIGHALGVLDLTRAAKVSGARFAFLQGAGSRLNRALASFFAEFHLARGDTELSPPFLVREHAMVNTGQLPKFKEDAFEVPLAGEESMYLIPTAEVSVTNYFANETLEEGELPKRFCAYSPCFRAEAGSAGKDTRGLIRMHQFEKVEMVRFATLEQADAELLDMVERASAILTALGLSHRIVEHCAGDLGFQAEKSFDIDVWFPAQNQYREISSCSSCGVFQARRAEIRYRPKATSENQKPKLQYVATLNGSGLPLGRTLAALLENHQQADGSVKIPEALWPYMGGVRVLSA